MMEICSKNKCTGCGMCVSACSFGAIQMREDVCLGHLRPVIDHQKCKDCGKCQRFCPSNNRLEQREPFITYAAWSENEYERKTSSSGGIAAALYRQFLNDGGYIVGTLFDDQMTAQLKITNDGKMLEKFKGSKYVQAQSGRVYAECLELLKSGKRVLFVGTPCQCAAMKKISDKNGENLYLVELICHGVPSPNAWRIHYNKLKTVYGDKISKVKFRTETFSICLTLEDSHSKILYQRNKMEDPYLIAFLNGALFGEGCFECPYAQRKRVADLVVGDFWGLGEKTEFPYPTRKVSMIGVVTEKGKQLLDIVNTIKLVEREYDEAVEGNPQLQAPFAKPTDYYVYENLSADERIEKIMYNPEKMEKAEKLYKNRKLKEQILFPVRIGKKILKALLYK